jgi:hypothetical protein
MASANRIVGQWQRVADKTAAGGYRIQTTDRGVSAPSAPAAAPASFVEAVFTAPAGVSYHVWVRLRAAADSRWNESVWLQFSDSLAPSNAAIYRVGTADALLVNLEDCDACGVSGWGWQDKAWYSTRSDVQFASSGLHVLRIQLREDGTQVDQVVLTPAASGAGAPGPLRGDTTILAATPADTSTNVVVCAEDAGAADIHGAWTRVADSSAAHGVVLVSADQKKSAPDAPLAAPAAYVDLSFPAAASTPYRIWVRLRATKDKGTNDSAWVQVSDATVGGASAYAPGTTSGLAVNLATCNGCAVSGWGWQSGAFWLPAPAPVTFQFGGMHTLRLQPREDGVQIDQVVLSPLDYLDQAPGAPRDDATILER